MIEPIKVHVRQGKSTADITIDKTGDFIIKFNNANPKLCKELISATDQFVKQNFNNGMDNTCFNTDTFERTK